MMRRLMVFGMCAQLSGLCICARFGAWDDMRAGSLVLLLLALTTMEIKAPADGILLHGPIEGATERVFKKGSQVNAHAAVVSIATPGDMIVTLSVSAKEVLRLKVGLTVKIKPDAIGADEIETTVAYVSALPRKGNFLVRCDLPEGTPAALLGTGGAVTIELPEAK